MQRYVLNLRKTRLTQRNILNHEIIRVVVHADGEDHRTRGGEYRRVEVDFLAWLVEDAVGREKGHPVVGTGKRRFDALNRADAVDGEPLHASTLCLETIDAGRRDVDE